VPGKPVADYELDSEDFKSPTGWSKTRRAWHMMHRTFVARSRRRTRTGIIVESKADVAIRKW
jgi:hypothetical protein